MQNHLKKNPWVKGIKRTKLYRLVGESQGNWQYPWIKLGWSIAGLVVPRRRVNCDGASFSLSCTNPITYFRWYLFSRKEKEVRHFIDRHVREGDVFFDIGANVGVFSLYCAKKYQDISVYCFEPEYSNLFLLKENIIKNDLTSKIKTYSLAISDTVGLSYLNIQDSTPGAAAHSENNQKLKVTDEGFPVVWAEGIMTATLDHLCQELKVTPNLLKIDTDGNEEKVLRGALKTLSLAAVRGLIIEMPLEKEKADRCRTMLISSGMKLESKDKLDTRNQVWIKSKHA